MSGFLAVDVMTGEIINRSKTDVLIRHKWPEEKPDGGTWALIRRKSFFGDVQNHVAWYAKDGKWYVVGFDDTADAITHWWELPEVVE